MLPTKSSKESETEYPKSWYGFFEGQLQDLDRLHSTWVPVPYIKELVFSYRIFFGIVAMSAYIALFVYFVYTLYISDQSGKYIALAGEEGDSTCSTVQKPLQGSYYISSDGYWEGSSNFSYANALANFEFHNLIATKEQFQSLVDQIRIRNNALNELLSISTLAFNLIFLMTGKLFFNVNGFTQTVNLVADASVVFNRQSMYTVALSTNEVCHTKSLTIFNSYTAEFEVSYPDQSCFNVFPFFDEHSTDPYTIKLDMRSAALAMNLNFQFIDTNFDNYSYMVLATKQVTVKGTSYKVVYLVDTRYPNMSLVVCVILNGYLSILCGMVVETLVLLPTLNQWGNKDDFTAQFCDW